MNADIKNNSETVSIENTSVPIKRNIFARIGIIFLWFVLIYFVSNMFIGGIVGTIAGADTMTYREGYAAGQASSIAFFQKYGLWVLLGQIIATVILVLTGVLPGTGKYKKKG